MLHLSLRRCSMAGFSLPEVLSVLAILGVLSGMATLTMRNRTRADATSGLTREVYTRLTQARFAAVSTGSRIQVRLRPGEPGENDTVLEIRPAVAPGLLPAPPLDGFGPVSDQIQSRMSARLVAVSPVADPLGAAPAPKETRLTFYPDGRAQVEGSPSASGATLYFADDIQRHNQRLVVMGRTGFVRLLEP